MRTHTGTNVLVHCAKTVANSIPWQFKALALENKLAVHSFMMNSRLKVVCCQVDRERDRDRDKDAFFGLFGTLREKNLFIPAITVDPPISA